MTQVQNISLSQLSQRSGRKQWAGFLNSELVPVIHRDDYFDYWGKGTSVTVTSEQQSAPSSVFAVSQCGSGSDGFFTFGCLTSGFTPAEPLKFKWTDPQGTELTDFIQYPAIKTSGTYTSVSHVRVKASNLTAEQPFKCTAEHPAGSKFGTIKMPVFQQPNINLVKVSDGKSIMCVLENFSPKSFTVKWKEDGADVTGLDLPAGQSKPGLYTAGSVLQVTESKWKKHVEYTCEVTHTGQTYTEKQTFTDPFSVKIKGPDVKELFVNNRAVMECVITGDNEQDVKEAKVSWTLNNQNQNGNDGKVQKTGQQYTKSSILDLDQTAWFSNNKVECSTTWRNKPISDNVTVNKRAQAPTLLIYKPDEKDPNKVSLVCEINDSPLGDVYVMWRKNDHQYIEGNFTSSVLKNDNSMSVFSILTVTQQEYNDPKMTFTCAVKHAGMKDYSQPLLKTTSKNPFSVKIKGPDVKELFINNRAVMECVITGDNEQDVKEAKVSWTLNNQNQNGDDGKVQKTGQQYTKSSTLDLDHTAWFSGNNVECSATWRNKHISNNITVNKKAQAPTLLIYKPEETDPNKVSLLCEINGSPLGDVYVMWRKNNDPYIEGNFTSSVIKNDNSMSVFSTLTVTQQEYDDPLMTFTCAVKHAGMENYSIPLLKTTSKIPEEQIVLYTDGATLDEDEFSSLWSTASSFIFLFIFSLIYSTVLSLSKMKS